MAIIRNFRLPEGIGVSADYIETFGVIQSINPNSGAVVSRGGVGVGNSISIGGRLQMFNGNYFAAFDYAGSATTVYMLPENSPATGTSVLQSTSAGVMSWVPMVASSAASGFTTLNGLSSGIQYFSVGSSGNVFNIVSSGSTHTFNIPIAGSGSTGLITTSSQTIAGQKTFSSAIIGDLTGTATTASYSHQSGYAITSGSSASATTASNINVVNAVTNSAHFIHFSPSATGSGLATSSNTTLSYNPSLNILSTSGMAITSTTASTSTSNGALQVAGGVGISGRLSFNQASFGTTGIAINPTMAMIGQTGDPIFLSILEDNSISFEGTQGQLFSITPNLSTGYIYSVNDITGIPLIRANANANVTANEYAGNFGIGLTNPGYKLHVLGSVGFTSTTASTSTSSGTLVVGGGVGIGGSLYVASATAISGVFINNGIIIGNLTGTASTATYSHQSGYAITSGLATTSTYSYQSGYGLTSGFATTAANINLVSGTTNSAHPMLFSPSSSGSGVAVSSKSTLSYNPSTDILSTSGLAVTATTQSTNPSSGALIVTGGVGIGGSLYVAGDLTINGTTTTINTVTLTVDDKNIELGSVTSPSDLTAEGGGITLKGTTDKSINWYTGTGWSSSESWNLASGNTYKINNTTVLSSSSIGTGITNSSLTALGTIRTGVWAGTLITAFYGGTGYNSYTKGDLLVGAGSTIIKFGVGSDNQILTANSTSGSGLSWATFANPTYGAFYSTSTQQVAGSATTTLVNFNATYESNRVQIYGGAGTSSRIQIQDAGPYSLTFSAQINLTQGSQPKTGDFWFRVNGVDVPKSNSEMFISGKDFQTVLTVNFVYTFQTNDYFEIVMSSNDQYFSIEYQAAGTNPPRPETPSIILTVLPITHIVGASGSGISGILSLNGSNTSQQYLFTGTSGNDFNISTSLGNHTFNIPIASTGATGLLSSQNQTIGGIKTFASGIAITATTASTSSSTGALTVSGGVGIGLSASIGGRLLLFNGANYTGLVSSATGNTVYTLPPTSPATGTSYLTSNSSGVMNWTAPLKTNYVLSFGAGFTPTANSADSISLNIPYAPDGTTKYYYVKRIEYRNETLSGGTGLSFYLQRHTTGNASWSTTNTITAGSGASFVVGAAVYSSSFTTISSSAGVAGSVVSGDYLRLFFTTVGSAANVSIAMTIEEQ